MRQRLGIARAIIHKPKLLILDEPINGLDPMGIREMRDLFVELGFLYLFAYAPMLEPNDKDMVIFSGYNNLIPLFGVLNMAVFCVLSAVMYSKFIIEDYSGKRPILLFSYPASRKKIVLAKLSVVCGFTISSMVISNFIIFLIFGITENFIHLVSGNFTFSIMVQAIETTLVMAFVAASIGVVAVGIGFIKKSVPNGYEIVSSLEKLNYLSITEGTLYPLLKRLQKEKRDKSTYVIGF